MIGEKIIVMDRKMKDGVRKQPRDDSGDRFIADFARENADPAGNRRPDLKIAAGELGRRLQRGAGGGGVFRADMDRVKKCAHVVFILKA